MPSQESYARFTDENGRIISGQFKTQLDVLAAKINKTVVRVGTKDASQVEKAKLHEFGSNKFIEFEEEGKHYKIKGVPARSFLRMPLGLFLPKALESIDMAVEENVDFNIEQVATALGQTSVEVVHEAFDSQGFGQWLPHQNEKYAENNDNPVLDKTGKLKNSIDFEIIERETI